MIMNDVFWFEIAKKAIGGTVVTQITLPSVKEMINGKPDRWWTHGSEKERTSVTGERYTRFVSREFPLNEAEKDYIRTHLKETLDL